MSHIRMSSTSRQLVGVLRRRNLLLGGRDLSVEVDAESWNEVSEGLLYDWKRNLLVGKGENAPWSSRM